MASPRRSCIAAVLVGAILLWLGTGCGTTRYRIGVLIDEPGVNYTNPSTTERSGFEVAMYEWMAFQSDSPFHYDEIPLTIGNREENLSSENANQVDFVVASYTITDDRIRRIRFAGPYFITQQGVLVRTDGPLTEISSATQIGGRKTCAQEDSTSAAVLATLPPGSVEIVLRIGLRECVDALMTGEVSAVSTDQILLRGYADFINDQNEASGNPLRLVVPERVTFGPVDEYGIAVPRDDLELCEELTERIAGFIASGAWAAAFESSFGVRPTADTMIPSPNALNACYYEPPGA